MTIASNLLIFYNKILRLTYTRNLRSGHRIVQNSAMPFLGIELAEIIFHHDHVIHNITKNKSSESDNPANK